jgi:hypothetical protein
VPATIATSPEFQCTHLDGTDEITCNFSGSHHLTGNKPSLAIVGEKNGALFLQCRPAIEMRAERVADLRIPVSLELETERFQRLISMQSACSQFTEYQP